MSRKHLNPLYFILFLIPVMAFFLFSWSRSLTGDEALTVRIVSSSWNTVMSSVGTDNHVPGYYSYLWLWVRVFGDSLLALRISSLVIALAAVIIAARCLPPLATLLFAVSPFMIHLSVELRMYGLLMLCGLFLLVALRKYCRSPSLLGLLMVALAVSAGTWVHHFGWLGLPAALTVMIITRREWKHLFAIPVIVLLLYIPWLSRAADQFGFFGKEAVSGTAQFLSSVPFYARLAGIPFSIAGTLLRFSSGTAVFSFGLFSVRSFDLWTVIGMLTAVSLVYFMIKGWRKAGRESVSIFLWVLLPLSILRPSVRHFTLAFPAFIVLAGAGLKNISGRWRPIIPAIAVILIALSVPFAVRTTLPQRCTYDRDFREAALLAARLSGDSIPVLLDLDLYTTLGVLFHFEDEETASIVVWNPHEELLSGNTIFYSSLTDALSYLMVDTDSMICDWLVRYDVVVLLANDPGNATGPEIGDENTFIGLGSDVMSDTDLIDVLSDYGSIEKIELPGSEGPFSLFLIHFDGMDVKYEK